MSSIKQNELLADYCTYHIGGPARCLFFAASVEEIIAGLEVAQTNNYPFFILGGGSNVLFPDAGFSGLVLKMENNFIESKIEGDGTILNVGAGTPLALLCNYALENSLTGMEWAAGIPGTVGGALRGNAGAFHEEMSESVIDVRTLEMSHGVAAEKTFPKSECGFSYRESFFKHNPNLVVTSARLMLAMGDKEKIKSQMDEYLAKKTTTQPLNYPSAGSVFANPAGFFAAKLIEDCGLKGRISGGAQVSEKHANFIVNLGGAKAEDVKNLIAQIKSAVKEKFNVAMKEEIEIVKN
ncbi:MAG: UDP-N-acetylmuramate dehydrogenase [Candidatus Paceibacterota bacterium]